MDKIDRLGWAAGISFVSYGVRVGVRVNKADILDRLVDRFPPRWKPSRVSVVERLYSVIVGGEGPRPNVRRF
jgi:3-deoxy-D-arabino-heptulosonate 7-phosphate (DAHP) synthase class II